MDSVANSQARLTLDINQMARLLSLREKSSPNWPRSPEGFISKKPYEGAKNDTGESRFDPNFTIL
jgi:hypothetical protein